MDTLYARRHEHDHRHDRPWLGELPRAPDGKPESPIYPSTHDRHYYCCACGHEGRKGGPPRVSLGRIHKLRAPMAAAAWRLEGLRTPFLVAATLDAIYQLIIHKFIYPLELLFTATLLALVPYFVLRGPVNRIARRFIAGKTETVDTDAGQ